MKTKTDQSKKTVGNYPVGDFLIRIKNASLARRKVVVFPPYKFVISVAKTLKNEGYLREVEVNNESLSVSISYKRKEPMITNIKLVSKPGLRIYMSYDELQKIKKPSILIISTPKGVMSSMEAIKKKLGGEVIAEVL
jgi:small subunit ribosomal protein S8